MRKDPVFLSKNHPLWRDQQDPGYEPFCHWFMISRFSQQSNEVINSGIVTFTVEVNPESLDTPCYILNTEMSRDHCQNPNPLRITYPSLRVWYQLGIDPAFLVLLLDGHRRTNQRQFYFVMMNGVRSNLTTDDGWRLLGTSFLAAKIKEFLTNLVVEAKSADDDVLRLLSILSLLDEGTDAPFKIAYGYEFGKPRKTLYRDGRKTP